MLWVIICIPSANWGPFGGQTTLSFLLEANFPSHNDEDVPINSLPSADKRVQPNQLHYRGTSWENVMFVPWSWRMGGNAINNERITTKPAL